MPLWVPPSALGKTESSVAVTSDATRKGKTVTASATPHAKGAWVEMIAASAEDAYGITIRVREVHTAATVTSTLLDIGTGPAASEVVVIEDLDCWGAPTGSEVSSRTYFFPVFIPKGERVAARSQALIVSDTCSVAIWLHQASEGWGMEVPSKWERLGAVTNSNGVSVTPASNTFGSWTAILDPITKPYRWWHVGFDGLADTTIAVNTAVMVELGLGDTSAAVSTIGMWEFMKNTAEIIAGPQPDVPVYAPSISDTALGVFARMAAGGVEPRGVLVYAGE